MGDGSLLDGRLLSTTGAVSVYGTRAFISLPIILSFALIDFTGKCDQQVQLNWTTAKVNDSSYMLQGSSEGIHWVNLEKMAESVNRLVKHTCSIGNSQADKATSYYRLFRVDAAGKKQYSKIVYVKPCGGELIQKLLVYPNPGRGQFNLKCTGKEGGVFSTTIFDGQGNRVYMSAGVPSKLALSHLLPGVYFVCVRSGSSVVSRQFVITKN